MIGYNSSSLHILFGFGFVGSMKLANGAFAHNDWLEILSNYGIIGVLIYFFLFYSIIKYAWNREWPKGKRITILTIVSMWLMISMLSMWYTSIVTLFHSIILAYLLGSKIKLNGGD